MVKLRTVLMREFVDSSFRQSTVLPWNYNDALDDPAYRDNDRRANPFFGKYVLAEKNGVYTLFAGTPLISFVEHRKVLDRGNKMLKGYPHISFDDVVAAGFLAVCGLNNRGSRNTGDYEFKKDDTAVVFGGKSDYFLKNSSSAISAMREFADILSRESGHRVPLFYSDSPFSVRRIYEFLQSTLRKF